MNENLGMKVEVSFADGSEAIFRNVTEIHYNYRRGLNIAGKMVAFESDIHQTGITYALEAVCGTHFIVVEFETTPETAVAEGFYA